MTANQRRVYAFILPPSSDAALGLAEAGDACDLFRRALGEQGEQVLGRHAGCTGDPAQRGRLAGGLGVMAAELDHLPVRGGELADAFFDGQRLTDLLGPFARVGHEAFIIDLHRLATDDTGCHMYLLSLIHISEPTRLGMTS